MRGLIKLELRDINTDEITWENSYENFIFNEFHHQLWTSTAALTRPVLVNRGSNVYPLFDKQKSYFNDTKRYTSGYSPSGIPIRQFHPKTANSPAYFDYYSLFLPPTEMSTIACISLSTGNSDNNTWTDEGSFGYAYTAINLNPPCYQSPTEYLNVYYRLVAIDDEDSINSDFIKDQFLLDTVRTNKVLYPSLAHSTYPFRISEDISKNNNINFLSDVGTVLSNSSTVRPSVEHSKLINAEKTTHIPPDHPNQYSDAVGSMMNTIIRAGNTNARMTSTGTVGSSGTRVSLAPIKMTPDIDENFTGLGNVFANSNGNLNFDPAYFPAGAGRMQVAGVLANNEKNAFPTYYQARITKPGTTTVDAEYMLYEASILRGDQVDSRQFLPLLPVYKNSQSSQSYSNWLSLKSLMYKEPNKIHCSNKFRVYEKNKSFITWDTTGITKYDIYDGFLESYDATTTPALEVTNVVDVKIDTLNNIWIACADTGLWKLRLSEDSITLTHIGVLAGSQQKCYAIEVDNHGNLFAIFWGQGLFYTIDSGLTWVNAIINYPPFSEYENQGFTSKWEYVSRIVCNQDRNVSEGEAQLLILMKSTGSDYALSGGCWYDQQSQLTTGITNTSMKSQIKYASDNAHQDNVVVSNDHDKWFFITSTSNLVVRSEYQQNSSLISLSNEITTPTRSFPLLSLRKKWDWQRGELREYLLCGVYNSTTSFYDVAAATTEIINTGYESKALSLHATSNVKMIGDDIALAFISQGSTGGGEGVYDVGYTLINIADIGTTLDSAARKYVGKYWGWNGSSWIENHLGAKQLHTDNQQLFRGAMNRFVNGPNGAASWVVGDTFSFHVFDGYIKDNSSTMTLRDTHYYRSTDVVATFDPPFVSLIDNTSEVGILNQSPIDSEWNIEDLPDTTYSGEALDLNGDSYFSSVVLLASFNGNSIIGADAQVIGNPTLDDSVLIFNEPSTYSTGEDGYNISSSSAQSLTSQEFVIEMTCVPEIAGVTQYLLDYRTSTNAVAAFLITDQNKLGIEVNNVVQGNVGEFLFPGQQYTFTFIRSANNWRAYVNGVLQFSLTISSSFAVSTPVSILKRFQINTTANSYQGFRGWMSNLRVSRGTTRNYLVDGVAVPTEAFKRSGNVYTGASLKLTGASNNGAIVARKTLIGDWEVIFRDLTVENTSIVNTRPLIAFGVSTQKFIESVTDISYRMIARRFQTFLQNWSSGTTIGNDITQLKLSKTNDMIFVYVSVDGIDWSQIGSPIIDRNPEHHICMWQVKPTEDLLTPSVEITKNGSAIFSRVGDGLAGTGYYDKEFLAMDVYWQSDINIQLDGINPTRKLSNYVSYEQPLEGEVLALESGKLVFHPNDIGKHITGTMMTLKDR